MNDYDLCVGLEVSWDQLDVDVFCLQSVYFTVLLCIQFKTGQFYVCLVIQLNNTAMGTRACARVIVLGGCPLLLFGSFAGL